MKIQIEVEITDEFLGDILTNAVETGSISYWARYVSIERKPDLTITRAEILEVEDDSDEDEDMPKHVIDFSALLRGIYCVLRGECRSDIVDYVHRGVRENDAGDIDSDCCDAIVQLGVLGEIRYG